MIGTSSIRSAVSKAEGEKGLTVSENKLAQCSECFEEFSRDVSVCPNCQTPNKKPRRSWLLFLIIIIGVTSWFVIKGRSDDAVTVDSPNPQIEQQNIIDSQVVASLENPLADDISVLVDEEVGEVLVITSAKEGVSNEPPNSAVLSFVTDIEAEVSLSAKDASPLITNLTAEVQEPMTSLGNAHGDIFIDDLPQNQKAVPLEDKLISQESSVAYLSLLVVDGYLDRIIRRAKDGNAMAQTVLGLHVLTGLGVEEDSVNARKLFTNAAKLGSPVAMYEIGRLYAKGLSGLSPDQFNAQKWFGKSIDSGLDDLAWSGNIFAMGAYGDALKNGNGGVSQNIQIGLGWLKKSADAGNPFAQYSLASVLLSENLFLDGLDRTYALSCLQSAAVQGHPDAQAMMDKMEEH